MRSVRSATPIIALRTRRRHDGGNARPVVPPLAITISCAQLDRIETIGGDIDAVPPDIRRADAGASANSPDKTLSPIDQFVLKGGKALVLSIPYSELQAGERTQPGAPATSDLAPLFKNMGVAAIANTVARPPERDAVAVPAGGGRAHGSITSPGSNCAAPTSTMTM